LNAEAFSCRDDRRGAADRRLERGVG